MSGDSLTKEYIPICMSFAPIVFTDLANFTVGKEASKDDLKRVLLLAVEQANAEYKILRAAESVLTEFVDIAEEIGRGMRAFVNCFLSLQLFC